MSSHHRSWTRVPALSMLAVVVSIGFGVGSVSASGPAGPTVAGAVPAASQIMDTLVRVSDVNHGYGISVPAAWQSSDNGDGAGYFPAGSIGQRDRLALVVTNLDLSNRLGGPNSVDVTYELFVMNPSLSGWTKAIESFWSRNGISSRRVGRVSDGTIYAATIAGQTELVAYVVSNGHPFVIELQTFGRYTRLQQMRDTGVLADIETIAGSLSSLSNASAALSPIVFADSAPLDVLPPAAGPYTNHVGWKWSTQNINIDYYMSDTYYQAPPTVYEMYESIYLRTYQTQDMFLLRAAITDNPASWCIYTSYNLVERAINKEISATTGIASDDYFPNKIVAHLNPPGYNPPTAHALDYGVGNNTCEYYLPFTH